MRPTGNIAAVALVGLLGAAGCSDGSGGGTDAGTRDARPDARQGSCADGEVEVQGDWTDWDSTDTSFKGIFDATITEVGNESNSITTAPNGRAVICLTAGQDHQLSFSHPDYLPMTFNIAAENLEFVYSVHGLTEQRADDLFAQELSLTRDTSAAQVLLEIPAAADASLDTAAAGPFRTLEDAYLIFANLGVAGPATTALSVTPPSGQSCRSVGTLDLAPGVISFTDVVCQ